MTQSFLPHPVEKAILHLFEDLATPVSLKASMLFKAGEWDQLATMRVVPEHYNDANSYWRDATAASILRKCVELPTSFNRQAVAESNFLSCEELCFRTNTRLLPYLSPGLPDTDEGVCRFIDNARKIASRILGPCPDTNETTIDLHGRQRFRVVGRFGPGATYGDRGRLTTVPDKMSSEPTLTPDAVYYGLPWLDTMWSRAASSSGKGPIYVQGNRFTTVPKDCEKDRGIAVEPSINLFYQLAYGRVIRHRLRLAGIDLAKGQDIHRQVACEASIEGHLCTLDLSNASDTICSNLVKLLLPSDWFAVLNDLRSKKTLFKGRWHVLEKFSSMGNGFTFELESLLFLVVILALDPAGHKLVPGSTVHVFGDDIIAPTDSSNAVMSALSFFGLAVNEKKSFVSGPFRESCGGDFFNGVDVRPYFLKESPSEPHQLISIANGLRRASKGFEGRSSVVRRAWFRILDALPSHVRDCRGPSGLGDLCIHDIETNWRQRQRSSIRYIKVWRPARYRKVAWSNFRSDVILASAVYGVASGARWTPKGYIDEGIIPRDAVSGYKNGWVAFS